MRRASRARRTLIAATVVALAIGVTPAVSAADSTSVRTFDAEPLGQPPAGTTVAGQVVVDSAPFGAPGNRAVHLTDVSTTGQSLVTFDETVASARTFEFDLALHQVKQPVFVAIQGTGASTSLGMWRFMIAPAYGRNADAQVSMYNGRAWQRLAIIPDLTERDQATGLRIDAGTSEVVLTIDEFVFRSTIRASAGTAVTGVQLASSGSTPTGSDVYLDNYRSGVLDAGSVALQPGIAPVATIASLTHGQTNGYVEVGTVSAPGARTSDLTAQVYVGNEWRHAIVTPQPGAPGEFRIRSKLTEPDIGLQPLTISLTDSRHDSTRSTQVRTQSYPRIPATVVAQEQGPRQPRFPDAIRLQDGSILVAYHFAAGHTRANGVVRVIRSTDDGVSWSQPRTVVENAWDNRDPKLLQLRDGTILLSTFRTDWTTSPESNLGTFLFRSDDNGETFPSETKIDSAEPGAWQHAPAVELPDGDIIQPLYGYGARIARSTDGGQTFPAANEMTVVADDAEYSNGEPNVVALPSGELVMLIRTADQVWGQETHSRLTRSFDGGHTWTPLETTDLPTSSHHMLVTADGSVLLTFGNQWQHGRPTYAALITDPSGPWTGYRQVPVFNSGWDDQANPTSVQLSDGSFLSFGFNVIDRTVLAFTTTEKTYR